MKKFTIAIFSVLAILMLFHLFENGSLEVIYKVSAENRDDSYVSFLLD